MLILDYVPLIAPAVAVPKDAAEVSAADFANTVRCEALSK
jgi:hypothetical protein